MAMPSADSVVNKWVQRMQGASQAYRDGIAAVQSSPMEAAANAQDRYLSGVQRAVESGRYRDGLMNVSLEEWKRSAREKGAARLGQGAEASREKMLRAMQRLLPAIDRIVSGLQPRGTTEQNIQRAVQFMQEMHQLKMSN